MLNILGILGLLSLVTSFIMLYAQWYNSDFMNKDKRKEYLFISQQPKNIRTEEEQYLIEQTWHKYYMSIIRIVSFKVGIIIVPSVLLLNYFIAK